jgi:hypothetical protein
MVLQGPALAAVALQSVRVWVLKEQEFAQV